MILPTIDGKVRVTDADGNTVAGPFATSAEARRFLEAIVGESAADVACPHEEQLAWADQQRLARELAAARYLEDVKKFQERKFGKLGPASEVRRISVADYLAAKAKNNGQ
jgi:hypothetical protein